MFLQTVRSPRSFNFWRRLQRTLMVRTVKAQTHPSAPGTASCLQIPLPSERETRALGGALARCARIGDVFLLRGELGSGKTVVARGFLQTFHRDPLLEVTSPTYLLDLPYPDLEGNALLPHATVHHLDLYRVGNAADRSIVDFEHIFRECISLIEWPERLSEWLLPPHHLEVWLRFVPDDETGRTAELVGSASGGRAEGEVRWTQTELEQLCNLLRVNE
ncbi:hypothetical protein CDCA_CDCA17G4340 [Cyanidium caldarium]|uniref:tRNA threonylcarbamoyladenosine biosynthesis protein TsaE n=1 Tax=Cyanidium caldarium TaxID=2771 RepID=A0AAV9J1V8_CYACA|nr:hypothetical protein CDCA_CDCA17G4340 [Cyanidium caldarium]